MKDDSITFIKGIKNAYQKKQPQRILVKNITIESETAMWMHKGGSAYLIKHDIGVYYGSLSRIFHAQLFSQAKGVIN